LITFLSDFPLVSSGAPSAVLFTTSTPGYPSAAINTKQAGECTAQFLMGMEENNEGFVASKVHAIGFSLGAHVASFASMDVVGVIDS
jgi:hypothetical protein